MGTFSARSKQYRAIANAAMLSVTLALAGGCGDNNSVSETPPDTSPGTVVGQVVSFATSAPVSGATVKTTSSTTTTAADGKFSVSAPAGNRTLVRVEATGFAEAFPVARVTSGQTTNLGVKLVPIGVTETVSVAAGGTVSVPNSPARVTIPANGLVPVAGGAPTGSVNVSLTPINPAVEPRVMPGGFNGIAAGGGTVQSLESGGAMQLDIRDSTGARYTLAPGTTATIRIPLGTQSATPPATMPLWFFDETQAVWREEGTATLQGTGTNRYYEGTIARVTYWNADLVLESIVVNGCVKDANGQVVANTLVQTEGLDYTGTAFDVTAADGTFSVGMRKSSRAKLGLFEFDPQTFNFVPVSNTVNVGPSATDITLPNCLVKQPGPLAITTTALPGGVVGVSYNQTLAASGGVPGYVWSLNAGSNPLPTGLTLNPAGVVSGTPTTDGTKTIIIKVTDSTGARTTKEFTLVINGVSPPPPPPPSPPSLTITTTALPTGAVGIAYNATVAATGGTGARKWTLSSGTLPGGLTLGESTGLISGTPATVGTSAITIRVEDSATPPQSNQKEFSLTISASACSTNCPQGTLTVSNAPPRVGGTFVADGTSRSFLQGDRLVAIWGESSGSLIDREVLSLGIAPSSSTQSKSIEFATVIAGSFFTETLWTCRESTGSEGPQCEGFTINRATGTATFSDVILNSNAAPPITLNGTLTFTPF